VDLIITIDNDLSAISPILTTFVSDVTSGIAAAATLPVSNVRIVSVDRGSVLATLQLAFPSEIAYGTAAEFALRAQASTEAGEVAWLLGPQFEGYYGRVIAVQTDVRADTGERLGWVLLSRVRFCGWQYDCSGDCT